MRKLFLTFTMAAIVVGLLAISHVARAADIGVYQSGNIGQELRWTGIVRVDGFAALKAAAGRGSAGLAAPTDIRAARFMVLMDPSAGPPIGAAIHRSDWGRR